MTVRIYTMTHKKFYEPEDTELYVPLHVGRAVGTDLGYLGDDTGENISNLNALYGELTGVYWVWKNDMDSDYIGICHYRRFFVDKERHLLKREDYEKILREYDVIVSAAMQAEGSYKAYYAEAHNGEDLEAVGRAIARLYPEDYLVFDNIINQSMYYYGNLFVTRRDYFCDYAKWLFSILEEAAKEIDVSSYDLYNRRVYGFLSEQLLLVWITARGLKACECPIGITAEKAETVELKLAIAQLVKQQEISQARELFYEFLKIRPDVQLELSDIKGELPIMEQLLYIIEEEENHRLEGMKAYSNQLPELMEHYKKMLQIMRDNWQCGLDKEADYFGRTNVSCIMIMVMLLNNPFSQEERNGILKQMGDYFTGCGRTADAEALEGMSDS